MEWWLGIAGALALLLGVAPVAYAAWARRRRWGRVIAGYAADGVGPYRAMSRAVWRDRGLPKRVGLAAGLGYAWGTLTLLVFAPAGSFLGATGMMLDRIPGWIFLPVMLVSLSGFGVGGALLVASNHLLHRRDTDKVRLIARVSVVHHVAVLGAFFALCLLAPNPEALAAVALFVGAPCAFGILQARLSAEAAKRLRGLEAEDAKTEAEAERAPWALVTR